MYTTSFAKFCSKAVNKKQEHASDRFPCTQNPNSHAQVTNTLWSLYLDIRTGNEPLFALSWAKLFLNCDIAQLLSSKSKNKISEILLNKVQFFKWAKDNREGQFGLGNWVN